MVEQPFDPKAFPYPIVTVDGARVLEERDRLSPRGVAVIIGNDDQAARVAEAAHIERRTPAEILGAASKLWFPQDWLKEQAREEAAAQAFLAAHPELPGPRLMLVIEDGAMRDATPEEREATGELSQDGPAIGEWPAQPEAMQFAAATSFRGPEPRLHIAILPTRDETEAPAYLRFGGWNACPGPEFHVAALRAWRETYGAKLITCSADQLELMVERRPSRTSALALARDQYAYCSDIIEQGFGTFAALAASLTVSDWWSFWWD